MRRANAVNPEASANRTAPRRSVVGLTHLLMSLRALSGTNDPTTFEAILSCDASARRSFCANATCAPNTTSLNPNASGAAAKRSPLVSMRLKSRSDGSLNGFRSLPLESLTLRSLPSIAVRRPRRRLLELSSESLELCGSLWRGKWPTRRSRAISSLQITYPEGPEQAAALETADSALPCFQQRVFADAKNLLGRVWYLCQKS